MAPQALSYDYPVPRNLPDLTFTPFLEVLEKILKSYYCIIVNVIKMIIRPTAIIIIIKLINISNQNNTFFQKNQGMR